MHREIAGSKVLVGKDEVRPAAKCCADKIQQIVSAEISNLDFFWSDSRFEAPLALPEPAMTVARELLKFAKENIGPNVVRKVCAWVSPP